MHEDFFNYRSGIYTPTTPNVVGLHAIKVVGYGYDLNTGTNYWTAANSWGVSWGENGYFRIAADVCSFDNPSSFISGLI